MSHPPRGSSLAGKSHRGEGGGKVCPSIPRELCIIGNAHPWHGCGPALFGPDPDLELLLHPGRGLEMLWQKKKTPLLADLKNHLGALQQNLHLRLVDHFWWLVTVPVILTSS